MDFLKKVLLKSSFVQHSFKFEKVRLNLPKKEKYFLNSKQKN